MKKIDKNSVKTSENFPHFIPDKPAGEDIFEGQSQQHLSDCIKTHILETDSQACTMLETNMPRIIGIEGKWGSGKSNVINLLGRDLEAEGYYLFNYDAWGHQEDLQRRSILETLTNELISQKILTGKSVIQTRNGEKKEDTWENQLKYLLSNKTTTITHSHPHLSISAIVGILLVVSIPIISSITGHLIDHDISERYKVWHILLELSPILLGAIICLICWIIGKKNEITKIISCKEDDIVDEQYTSSEEPSVMEFKNWMQAISDTIGKTKNKKKLIIVFDNMDRLPSTKVSQLWSSIYTFFAGSEFENIWTIIPYDYNHLCDTMTNPTDSNDGNKTKEFINKTFPIVYRVPQPVITDYREMFMTFFQKAFGLKTEDVDSSCQLYMNYNPTPNPRSVITFINELVSMRLQWRDSQVYKLEYLTYFILKKNKILYNNNRSMEEALLDDKLYDDIKRYLPDTEDIRKRLCQFAYGLKDEELAEELPLSHVLTEKFADGSSINEYINRKKFIIITENTISKIINTQTLDNIAKSLSLVDTNNVPDDIKPRLEMIWNRLANMKATCHYSEQSFDKTLDIILAHTAKEKAEILTKHYCKSIQDLPIKNGGSYYFAIKELQESLIRAGHVIDVLKYIHESSTEPKYFCEYVNVAKEKYKTYKLSTDNNNLNTYLLDSIIQGNDSAATALSFIYQDSHYDFNELGTKLSDTIAHWESTSSNDEIRVPAYVNRLLNYKGKGEILKTQFSLNTISKEINYKQIQNKPLNLGCEDVIAMYLAKGNDINQISDEMITKVSSCIDAYMNYANVLSNLGNNNSAFRKLNKMMIEKQLGERLNSVYAAIHLKEIKQVLELEYSIIFAQFNRWPKINEWEQNYIDIYDSVLPKDIIKICISNPGDFSSSLIELGLLAMKNQPTGFLLDSFNSNGYWKEFIKNILGTDFLPAMTPQLETELLSILEDVQNYNRNADNAFIEFMLTHLTSKEKLMQYLNDKLNSYFSTNDITPLKFNVFGKLLPKLGTSMPDATKRGLIMHLIKPIYQDIECAKIIIEHKDFYYPILQDNPSFSESILKEMNSIDVYTDFFPAQKTRNRVG